MSLKTKITTLLFPETVDYYKEIFGMQAVEEWDTPGDRGVILGLDNDREEAFLEIYLGERVYDFSGLSLQFRVDSLDEFADQLSGSINVKAQAHDHGDRPTCT